MKASVLLTSAQIQALAATAVVLVPAPTSPGLFSVGGALLTFIPGSDSGDDPLTSGGSIALYVTLGSPARDGVTHLFTTDTLAAVPQLVQFGDQSTGLGGIVRFAAGSPPVAHSGALTLYANLAIELSAVSAAAITGNAAGDGTLQVDLEYTLHAVLNPVAPRTISQQYSQ